MYAPLDFVKRILRDDFLTYPQDMGLYYDFAEAEINSRLLGTYTIPFTANPPYTDVPMLIQWITAYLVGYKIYDEMTALENLENHRGHQWWAMAQLWLSGLVEGTHLLHLADGTVVVSLGSTTSPRFYPNGVRDKAPSADNLPLFTRSQVGEW